MRPLWIEGVEWIGLSEAAEILGYARHQTVLEIWKSLGLPLHRIGGGNWRVRREDVVGTVSRGTIHGTDKSDKSSIVH